MVERDVRNVKAVGSNPIISTIRVTAPLVTKKKETILWNCSPKDSFTRIRYISKEVCRILRLWTQMQCLSGKTDIRRNYNNTDGVLRFNTPLYKKLSFRSKRELSWFIDASC